MEDSLSGMQAAQVGIGRVIALVGDGGHAQRGAIPPDTMQIKDLTELDKALFSNDKTAECNILQQNATEIFYFQAIR